MTNSKIVVVSILTCIALSIGLVVTTANSVAIFEEKDSEIDSLNLANAGLRGADNSYIFSKI